MQRELANAAKTVYDNLFLFLVYSISFFLSNLFLIYYFCYLYSCFVSIFCLLSLSLSILLKSIYLLPLQNRHFHHRSNSILMRLYFQISHVYNRSVLSSDLSVSILYFTETFLWKKNFAKPYISHVQQFMMVMHSANTHEKS